MEAVDTGDAYALVGNVPRLERHAWQQKVFPVVDVCLEKRTR